MADTTTFSGSIGLNFYKHLYEMDSIKKCMHICYVLSVMAY